MKTIKHLLIIALVGMSLVSCDQISDLTAVTVPDVEVKQATNFDITSSSAVQGMKITALSKTFTKSGSIKLSDVPEFSQYVSKLKSITIKSGSVYATDLNPGTTVITGLTITFPDLAITKENTSPIDGSVKLSFTADEFAKIAAALKANTPLNYTVSGSVSNYPVTFVVYSSFTADIKVGIL
jgi:hypothetical protein